MAVRRGKEMEEEDEENGQLPFDCLGPKKRKREKRSCSAQLLLF